MTNEHFCPLCQTGATSGKKKSTIVESSDGTFSVECSDCGDFRITGHDDIQSMQQNPITESRFDQMRRMISVENNFGMIPTFTAGYML